MLFGFIYQQKLHERKFVQKQLNFQKTIFEKLIKQCTTNLNQKDYHECSKRYKQQIKSFGIMTQLLIQNRTKEINQQIKKCSELKDLKSQMTIQPRFQQNDKILNCVDKQVKNKLNNSLDNDFKFLQLMQESILKNLK